MDVSPWEIARDLQKQPPVSPLKIMAVNTKQDG
jgi:hypothetical protein